MPDSVTGDLLETFDIVRGWLFSRLEGLTDSEYLWEPVSDCLKIRPGVDGVFGVDQLFPPSVPGRPNPFTTIARRIMHIGSGCLRGYVTYCFEDVPDLGDRCTWAGTAKAASTRSRRTGSASSPASQGLATSACWRRWDWALVRGPTRPTSSSLYTPLMRWHITAARSACCETCTCAKAFRLTRCRPVQRIVLSSLRGDSVSG